MVWGRKQYSNNESSKTITWSLAFPERCVVALKNIHSSSSEHPDYYECFFWELSTTGANTGWSHSYGNQFSYLAIGY